MFLRPGPVYVFTRNGSIWSKQAKLSIGLAFDHANAAWSASLDGDTALVGGRSDADAFLEGGSALVLARSGETWQLEAKLVPSDQAPLWYFRRGRAKPCTPD